MSMNKTALKSFAINARRELLEKVELQARKIGITAESILKEELESSDAIFIGGKQLSKEERTQRNKLIARISEIGFNRVMEEAAYTWFNRFTALRFMEVNEYLPTKVRVLSSTHADSTEPDMMKEALSLDLDLDKEFVYEMKMNNKTDDLFKYLIKMHCNDLNKYMSFMFEAIEDYKEILFPEGLLGTDSFVSRMTDTEIISEEDWANVEIVGWLYQYYISEENERVIKAKKRYKTEEIPFATQLFTPDWIVRYMVQNALGRYWVESHTEHHEMIQNWEFYLKNPNPELDIEEKLAPFINKELNVEEIKCFDPAMGSGHILVYMFDVLFEIYSKCGYMEREIPRLIIEKNLFGLDIDDRAYQLASFSVVMKAMQYNKRFLRSIERDGLTMNLATIQETNNFTEEEVAFLAGESYGESFEKMNDFINQFHHAKAIGSLITLDVYDVEFLENRMTKINQQTVDLFEFDMKERTLTHFKNLMKQSEIMHLKYDVFITNPPYAGNKYVTSEISSYLATKFPDVKSDLFSAFIEYSFQKTKENGQIGFMSPFVWMFISSYEKLRQKILNDRTISSLVQLEYSGFDGATVPICTFTLRNYRSGIKSEYVRLSDFRGANNQSLKTLEAVQNPNVAYRYSMDQKEFSKIPGSPIAYWATENMTNIFLEGDELSSYGIARRGLQTGDSPRFIRNWFEVNITKTFLSDEPYNLTKSNDYKWFLFNSGGSYRKWYGNIIDVVDWGNDGENIKLTGKAIIPSEDKYFKSCISWNKISSGKFSVRYQRQGIIQGDASPFFYTQNESMLIYILALLNVSVVGEIMKILSPTLNFEVGNISKVPVVLNEDMKVEIEQLVNENVNISKLEWDSYETSWDFKKHPIMYKSSTLIEIAFNNWKQFAESQFNQLRANEEALNSIFSEVYGMKNELSSEVDEKNITIQKADLERDIKSFISYAIGCSFGRYSLDETGLVYAGGKYDASRYKTYPVDHDNILPILPGTYFEDDVVSRFVDFVQITFGIESLSVNLEFVANAIGRRNTETATETLRRYFMNDFYKEHHKTYKKRPIYWLFTSGKEKAFNCLIYMHRYDKTTLSRIRTDYLHEYQIRLDAEKKDLLNVIEGDANTKEISNAKKELKSLDKKIDELKAYDELLHHMADMQIEIDLDDGVVVNYEKFKGLVAKI